ncbi:MAG TPA: sigma-70 family RNA polymerase sigma factor [Candidatus Polarisedimenticolia bacterium]|jgi:RNA polymerase sigma-70 factor (ECF subfamily)|nr:sigma-70 family RNA polymerase sigma factor [Candidatus Polarisedimenticolia bacterium]
MRNLRLVSPDSEEELVRRARLGDADAFQSLVRQYLPRLWKVAWRILRHREDTEDVMQEVFLSAYRALPEFRGESSLSTWLHRIAVTRALNHRDKAAERIRRVSDPWTGFAGERFRSAEASETASPLRTLETRELMRRVSQCLEKMPMSFRAVLSLRDVETLSYEETARILGIALGTVRSRLARARLALRECVQEEG